MINLLVFPNRHQMSFQCRLGVNSAAQVGLRIICDEGINQSLNCVVARDCLLFEITYGVRAVFGRTQAILALARAPLIVTVG